MCVFTTCMLSINDSHQVVLRVCVILWSKQVSACLIEHDLLVFGACCPASLRSRPFLKIFVVQLKGTFYDIFTALSCVFDTCPPGRV